MILSGYQLGVNLIQSSPEKLNLRRDELVKSSGLTVMEYDLAKTQQTSTRNSLFRVILKDRSFIVKQPKVLTAQTTKSFRKEAFLYELLGNTDFRKFIPEIIDKDEVLHLLYLEDINTLNVVQEFKFDETEPYKPELEGLLTSLAEVFNLLHLYRECPAELRREFGFERPLLLHFTEHTLHNLLQNNARGGLLEAIDLLQDEKVFNGLKSIQWEARCLINYEFKFNHILKQNNALKLVDWEFADFGDPDYDLASVLFEIYRFVSPYYKDKAPYARIAAYFKHFLSCYTHNYDPVKINQYFAVQVLSQYIHNNVSGGNGLQLAGDILKGDYSFDIGEPPHHKDGKSKPLAFKPVIHKGKSSKYNYKVFQALVKKIREYVGDNNPVESKVKEKIYQWYYRQDEIDLADYRYSNSKTTIADIPSPFDRKIYESQWWKVQERTDKGQIVARKNSEKRLEGPGQFYIQSDSRTNFYTPRKSFNDTAYVSLVFPDFAITRNTAEESKMDLWVNGKNKVRQDYVNWIRFYFHLQAKTEGIYFFIEELRNLFDDRAIPFELKLRNDLNRYCRADCAILYIHRQHFIAALHPIRTIYDRLKEFEYMRKEVPRFTKQLATGLGFAENPYIDVDSFGNMRAGIAAKSMVKNWHKKNDEIVSGIIEDFAEEGFNTYELYRNPNFGKNEYKYRFDLFGKIKAYFKIKRPPANQLRLNKKKSFLDAARHIAFIICKEAIWYGNYCNWLSFRINSHNEPQFQLLNQEEKVGVGLFLAGMSILCPEDFIFLDIAKGCYSEKQIADSSLTPHDVYKLYCELIQAQNILYEPSNNVDSFYYDMFTKPEKSWGLIAHDIIATYFDKGIPFPNAYCKDWNDENGTELCFTLTHGLAALGYFFMGLSEKKGVDTIIPFKDLFFNRLVAVVKSRTQTRPAAN